MQATNSNCDMLSPNPDNDVVKMRIAMSMVSKSRLPGRRLKVACSQCDMSFQNADCKILFNVDAIMKFQNVCDTTIKLKHGIPN